MRLALCLLVVLPLTGCSQDTSDTDASDASASAVELAVAPSPLPDPDACGVLPAEAIQRHVPAASGMSPPASDPNEAIRYDEDARSCAWMWDGHRVDLHIKHQPEGDDAWGSQAVAARVSQGYARVDGIGDEAAFREDRSELFWRDGPRRTYLLSYGGPSPSARLDLASLLALAAEIES